MLLNLSSEWQNLNLLTGIAVGNEIFLQSQSSSRIYLRQSATEPPAGSLDAVIIDFKETWIVKAGSITTWVRVSAVAGQMFVEV